MDGKYDTHDGGYLSSFEFIPWFVLFGLILPVSVNNFSVMFGMGLPGLNKY